MQRVKLVLEEVVAVEAHAEDAGGDQGHDDLGGPPGQGAGVRGEDRLLKAPLPGWQFNRTHFGLSSDLKNSLRFHFDSVTCLNYSVV